MALNVKPQFQAERVTGKFTRTVMHIGEDVRMIGPLKDKSIITRTMTPVKEEFTEAYMIYFPQGHSMLVAADDVEQLMRIGVLDNPKMVDMETGARPPLGPHPARRADRPGRSTPGPTRCASGWGRRRSRNWSPEYSEKVYAALRDGIPGGVRRTGAEGAGVPPRRQPAPVVVSPRRRRHPLRLHPPRHRRRPPVGGRRGPGDRTHPEEPMTHVTFEHQRPRSPSSAWTTARPTPSGTP